MAITNIYEEKISNKKEQKVSEINSRGRGVQRERGPKLNHNQLTLLSVLVSP